MKKYKMRLMALILVSLMALTGCGTQLYELTDDERDLIVDYAAYAVGKYNIYQKDGMTNAIKPEVEETETVEDTQESSETTEEPTTPSGENAATGGNEVKPAGTPATMADALGCSELDIDYIGSSVGASFQEGGYYSIDADYGYKMLIMSFKVSNKTNEKKSMDMLSAKPKFKVNLADGNSYTEKANFATYALSTFKGDIDAGKNLDMVVIFQVPESADVSEANLSLTAEVSEQTYLIEL